MTLTPQVKSLQRFFYDATFDSRRIVEIGLTRVGYFHLWAGTHGAYLERLNAALEAFEQMSVDAIVLDFRGGFGGRSGVRGTAATHYATEVSSPTTTICYISLCSRLRRKALVTSKASVSSPTSPSRRAASTVPVAIRNSRRCSN